MLSIVGFGSGAKENMTLEAVNAIEAAELVVGFGTYAALLRRYFPDKQFYETGMLQERERCAYALKQARQGKQVALVCSGDSGIYGMAGLIYEMAAEMDLQENVEIRVVSGVTAASSGAALLGAPLSHDFAVISLSDCLTPWELIEKRLRLAAQADLVICIYNPASKRRADYLKKACDILLSYKSADTVCGYVKNIGRNGQESGVLTLEKLRCFKADMFTTVYVGNSQTKNIQGMMATPRGYKGLGNIRL